MSKVQKGRGIIVGRRCPKIQLCPTCGKMRCHHTRGLYVCEVPPEVTTALKEFARTHGLRWKSALRDAWMRGDDVGSELQQARNLIGPTRLGKITV